MDRAELIGLDRELAERFYLAGDRSTIADISAQCAFFLGIGRTSTFHELTAARQETIASLAGEPLATLAPRAPFIDGIFEACRCTLKRSAYRSSSEMVAAWLQ